MSTGSSLTSLNWVSTQQSGSKTTLVVNKAVTKRVSAALGNHPCNFVAIFGAAREGKSFLMNCLAHKNELFQTASTAEPCTQGVDISGYFMPVPTFAVIHDDRAPPPRASGGNRRSEADEPYVGFLDVEGQGDRDVAYDANLICPILLASKCVIFNWKGSVQKDKILNLLGIMYKAALHVADEAMADEESSSEVAAAGEARRLLGHLHIVFRDWQHSGNAQSVKDTLLKKERSAEPDARLRNSIREDISSVFATIDVWLMPTPSVKVIEQTTKSAATIAAAAAASASATASRGCLSIQDCSKDFTKQVDALRSVMVQQMLAGPTRLGGSNIVLRGDNVGQLVVQLVHELNEGHAIRPQSAYVNMKRQEAIEAKAAFEEQLSAMHAKMLKQFSEEASSSGMVAATGVGVSPSALVTLSASIERYDSEVAAMREDFDFIIASIIGDGLKGTPYEADVLQHVTEGVKLAVTDRREHLIVALQNLQRKWYSQVVADVKRQVQALLTEYTTSSTAGLVPATAQNKESSSALIDDIVKKFHQKGTQIWQCAIGTSAPVSASAAGKSHGPATGKRQRLSEDNAYAAASSREDEENDLWTDTSENLANHVSTKEIMLRTHLQDVHRSLSARCAEVKDALQRAIAVKLSPTSGQGLSLKEVVEYLNEVYFAKRDEMNAACGKHNTGDGTIGGIVLKSFHEYCLQLNGGLKARYDSVQEKAIGEAVQREVTRLSTVQLPSSDPVGSFNVQQIFEGAVQNAVSQCYKWDAVTEGMAGATFKRLITAPLQRECERLQQKLPQQRGAATAAASSVPVTKKPVSTSSRRVPAAAASVKKEGADEGGGESVEVDEDEEMDIAPTLNGRARKVAAAEAAAKPSVAERRARAKVTPAAKPSAAEQRARAKEWASSKGSGKITAADKAPTKLSVAEQRRRAKEWAASRNGTRSAAAVQLEGEEDVDDSYEEELEPMDDDGEGDGEDDDGSSAQAAAAKGRADNLAKQRQKAKEWSDRQKAAKSKPATATDSPAAAAGSSSRASGRTAASASSTCMPPTAPAQDPVKAAADAARAAQHNRAAAAATKLRHKPTATTSSNNTSPSTSPPVPTAQATAARARPSGKKKPNFMFD